MDADDNLTLGTQTGKEPKTPVQISSGRNCPQCGLSVPLTVSACPKDGTQIDDTLGEGRKLVGNYEFLEFIGSGGMGVIYKAKHPVLKRVVAIKMLHSHLMSDVITRRFQQEAEAVSGLSHPCIIAVHDYGVSEHGQPYMVMDYIDGKPLSEILRQGPLRVEAAINIAIQLAHALQHAHEGGVLHRDLKPSNIMVTDYECAFPEVKIVDFGIAKILETDAPKVTQTGELLGTPQYMSPEQCRGAELDARSDIYSLGCVLFESITGKPPFVGSSMVSVIVDQISKPVRTLAEVRPDMSFPPQLEDLMARALAKDPGDRYASMNAMLVDLNQIQTLVGSPDKKQSPGARTYRLNREQRQLLLISLAAGFSLLGVAGSSLMFVNMVNKALAGRVANSTQFSAQEQNAKLEKLLFLERTRMARYLDPKRMDDKFFNNYYNVNLGITALDLADSHITDKAMAILPTQKDLHFLTLNDTPITDAGIGNLRMLHNLLELHLNRTGLTDKGMTYVSEIKTLKTLSVKGTPVTDRGVEAVSGLGLSSLFLSGTQITDQSLKTISSFKQMQRLSIRACRRVKGDGIRHLIDLPTLQYLDLENCPLNPAGIASLGRLKHLIALEFGGSGVTTDGIKVLSRIETLEYLNVDGTRIEAAWIPILGKLPRLRSLVLNACSIEPKAVAAIPEYLPNLTQLQFRYTRLDDETIAPLAKLKHLQFIDMERSGVTKEGAERLQKQVSSPGHVVQVRY